MVVVVGGVGEEEERRGEGTRRTSEVVGGMKLAGARGEV
jgi:hypothetical protein